MPDLTLKQIQEEMGTTFAAFKKANDKMQEEIKTLGTASGETVSKVERIQEALDTAEKKYSEWFEKIEAKLARPASEDETKEAEAKQALIVAKAYDTYLRKGKDALSPEEVKVLSVSDDQAGGYLAPTEMLNELIKGIVEFSPLRQIARVRSTSFRAVRAPKRTQAAAATWTGETQARTETQNPKYGAEEIPAHEMTAEAHISFEDLEDSAINMESEINMEFSEQFGVTEGTAFITGNAVKKPEGILTNSSVSSTNNGHATVLQADGLIALFYAVKTVYANQGWWVLNRDTLRQVRQLKDGNGQYIWSPNLAIGRPPTILERPYIEAVDMPNVASGTTPIAFGDFRRGYMIIDRLNVAVTRDPYSQAANGLMKFVGRKRVGGQVVLAEAFQKLLMST